MLAKNKLTLLFYLGTALIISGLLVFLAVQFIPEPPGDTVARARMAIIRSGNAKGEIYSSDLYREAVIAYDSAMSKWQAQNRRFILLRNFDEAEKYAGQALRKADEASETALKNHNSLKFRVSTKIDSLNSLSLKIDSLFRYYPLTPEIRERIAKGKLFLEESEQFYNAGNYLPASRKLTEAEFLLGSSYDFAGTSLKSYFEYYPEWKKWIDITIRSSKEKKDYAIIVDKFARKCIVYFAGIKKYEFNAELGINWVGNKRYSGDKATPEGMYKVAKKIDNGRTKYYKALLIDYPNPDDKTRFEEDKSKGELPFNSKIGGLIEIHGNGGKGADWTDGCIAVTDKEMDLLFRIAKTGTPVTIVGSMSPLGNI